MGSTDDKLKQLDQEVSIKDEISVDLTSGPSIAETEVDDGDASDERNQSALLDQHHWDFVNFEEEYIDKYIQLADLKASIILAVISALLGYIVDRTDILDLILKFDFSFSWFLALLSSLSLIIAAGMSIIVIKPRFSKSEKGIVFWKSITEYKSADSYLNTLSKMGFQEILNARVKHSYDLAKICSQKHDYLLKSMLAGFIGIVLSITIIVFG